MLGLFKKSGLQFQEKKRDFHFSTTFYLKASRSLATLAMALLLGLIITWLQVIPVHAAGITVNSNADTSGGPTCTLRNAITSANTDTAIGGCTAGSGTDTITFASNLSGITITLTSSLPSLTSNITIDGSSLASHIKISGNGSNPILYVSSIGYVTLTHLDLTRGASAADGGIIVNLGTMTINNSAIGSSNVPTGNGGGIWNYNGILTVNNSIFRNNYAAGAGGGIYNEFGTLTVNNSTFANNVAGGGAGIFNQGTLTLNNNTFSGNYNDALKILSGTVVIKNNILANSVTGGDCINTGGTIAIASNNLIEDNTNACGLTNGTNGNIIGSDPNLGALANNGGSTQTFALLTNSHAINAGNGASCLSNDQRGYARVGVCDIGAYEYTPPMITTSTGSGMAFFNAITGTLSGLMAVSEATTAIQCNSLPTGYIFPHGFFEFNITAMGSGNPADMTITLPNAVPANAKYFLCKNNNTWVTVPMDINGNNITVHFRDGNSVGDADGIINGIIQDPGGLGIPGAVGGVAEMITMPTASTSGLGYLAGLAGVVMLVGAGWLVSKR